MAKVFLSYSHKDEGFREALLSHMAVMRRDGLIDAWHDRCIKAGEDIDNAIDSRITAADVFLLLFSSDFIDSHYCYEKEAMAALERYRRGEVKMIPIIVRPCEWRRTPFGKILAAPRDGKAITDWTNPDAAYLDVTEKIREALTSQATSAKVVPAPRGGTSEGVPSIRTAGAGRLRLPLDLTDEMKDKFIADGFDTIFEYFCRSLDELMSDNPSLSRRVEKIDSRSFEVTIYRQGKTVSKCGIWIARGVSVLGNILYSSSGVQDGGACTDSAWVKEGDGKFGWHLTMGSFRGGQKILESDALAEEFWKTLIEPLRTGR